MHNDLWLRTCQVSIDPLRGLRPQKLIQLFKGDKGCFLLGDGDVKEGVDCSIVIMDSMAAHPRMISSLADHVDVHIELANPR